MEVTLVNASSSPCGMNALLFTPASNPANASGQLPLLVYLHGAGERGTIHEHLYRHGVPKLIEEGAKFNAVILVPQCPEWAVWDNVVDDLKQLIDETMLRYAIKRDRVSLTGSSMGGYGTFAMGISYPTLFAGEAPVAAVYARAKELGMRMVVESENLNPDGLSEVTRCMNYLRSLEK